MTAVDEPRLPHYFALEEYAVSRVGTQRPYSNTSRQLNPYGITAVAGVGVNRLFTGEVWPEMWQLVADCYGVE